MNKPIVGVLLLLACALSGCSAIAYSDWPVGTVSNCDVGVLHSIRISRYAGPYAPGPVQKVDIAVHGACGLQVFNNVDSVIVFRILSTDSVVVMDFRFDGFVARGWRFRREDLIYPWIVMRSDWPFRVARDEDVPDDAATLYSVCFGQICRGVYK